MLRYIKEYRFYIILFFFILIPVVSIDTANRKPSQYAFYDRAIVSLTAPIQTALTWTLDNLVSAFQNYVFLQKTRKDNLELIQENRRLRSTITSLQETQSEIARLRKLMEFRDTLGFKAIGARVIAKDVSTEYRAIRIDRGEAAGVRPDMAVVTNEGIVGRVLRTTPNTADVVTITDFLSAVDGVISRTRIRGIVEGMTDEMSQLRFILRTDDIQPNDLVVTSGLGGVFPKGLPIGTVSLVRKLPYGITQQVEIRPSVNFHRLEEVLIVTELDTKTLQEEGQTLHRERR